MSEQRNVQPLWESLAGELSEQERCQRIFALLSAYLDKELPEGDCETIRAHIADCPPCIAFVESLNKTTQLCRQYAPEVQAQPLSATARAELERAYQEMLDRRRSA